MLSRINKECVVCLLNFLDCQFLVKERQNQIKLKSFKFIIQTNKCTPHTYIHTHIHTYTHIYVYI